MNNALPSEVQHTLDSYHEPGTDEDGPHEPHMPQVVDDKPIGGVAQSHDGHHSPHRKQQHGQSEIWVALAVAATESLYLIVFHFLEPQAIQSLAQNGAVIYGGHNKNSTTNVRNYTTLTDFDSHGASSSAVCRSTPVLFREFTHQSAMEDCIYTTFATECASPNKEKRQQQFLVLPLHSIKDIECTVKKLSPQKKTK